ncbi:MAG: Uma2 family endonuclease [Chloroflexi bacterium]|nr:Uma2 family endonuclease [Chloroflexota bacterium]
MVDAILENTAEALVTGEALAEMGDIGRCELVEGKIIMRSPTGWRHGKYERRLGNALGDFVDEHSLGEVLVGEVGIYTGRNPDTIRGADVIFISNERLAQIKSASFLDVAPELVVEIMSPDDRWTEVKQKIHEYFSIGVILVWVADPADKSVSVYRSLTDVRIFTENDTLNGEEAMPGFNVSVANLFAD